MKKKSLMTLGCTSLTSVLIVMKFFKDFDILQPLICKCPTWMKYFTQSPSLLWAYDWAISFSWWGNIKSMPPEWISSFLPKIAPAIAEHYMCHPGLPSPHWDFQVGYPGFAAFHRAKSSLFFFSFFSSTYSAYVSASFILLSLPYLNFFLYSSMLK